MLRGSRGNDSYKNNRMGGQSYGSGGGYGHSNPGGISGGGSGGGYRGGGGHSDYPKKYSHQSPGGGHHNDASPPPYKRNRKDYEDTGRTDSYSSPQVNYNQSSHQKPHQ